MLNYYLTRSPVRRRHQQRPKSEKPEKGSGSIPATGKDTLCAQPNRKTRMDFSCDRKLVIFLAYERKPWFVTGNVDVARWQETLDAHLS